jgi:hypothetical protein
MAPERDKILGLFALSLRKSMADVWNSHAEEIAKKWSLVQCEMKQKVLLCYFDLLDTIPSHLLKLLIREFLISLNNQSNIQNLVV